MVEPFRNSDDNNNDNDNNNDIDYSFSPTPSPLSLYFTASSVHAAPRDVVHLRWFSPHFSGLSIHRRFLLLRQLGSGVDSSQKVGPLHLPISMLFGALSRQIPLAVARRSIGESRSQGAEGVTYPARTKMR